MSDLTAALVAELDAHVAEIFGNAFEDTLVRIEAEHDLDDPAVIAAIATCADVAAAQARLIARSPAVLVEGLQAALRGTLRPAVALLVHALLDGAQRELAAPPTKKKTKLPAFARPARLPPIVDATGAAGDVEALVREIVAAKLGAPPETPYSEASLAQLGRALVLGWLSHGADPRHVWGAWAAAHFPDDATARDLAMMAREPGPGRGQLAKAEVLVDVLGAMNTRLALELLQGIANKTRMPVIENRARAAFDTAAQRSGLSGADLADKLMPEKRPSGKAFVKRLEQRMVTGARMPAVEFVENILQRDPIRAKALGVVFGAQVGSTMVTFTIADDGRLVDVDRQDFTLPGDASVLVVHPLDLSAAQLQAWRAHIDDAPFAQLDREVRRFASLRAMTKHLQAELTHATPAGLLALEQRGWTRRDHTTIQRTLGGITVEARFSRTTDPTPHLQLAGVVVEGDGHPRTMAELARELATLTR